MADQEICSYAFGPYRFDARDRILTRGRQPVTLPPKAAELLAFLLEHAGRVLEKRQILDVVWRDTFVESGNLTYTIHLLRKILGVNADGKPYIETHFGRGYR